MIYGLHGFGQTLPAGIQVPEGLPQLPTITQQQLDAAVAKAQEESKKERTMWAGGALVLGLAVGYFLGR